MRQPPGAQPNQISESDADAEAMPVDGRSGAEYLDRDAEVAMRLVGWLLLATGLVASAPVSAAEPLAVAWGRDGAFTAAGFALAGSAVLFEDELAHAPCDGLCDASKIVLSLDRAVVGNHSEAARRWSDGLITGLSLAPLAVFAAADGWETGSAREAMLTDLLIVAQAESLNVALNTVVKHAAGRKRPLTYDRHWSEAERTSADASLSFYSGHSASAFALATATSRVFMLRHPDSDWMVPLWVGSEALAATTAVLRVEAGKHFWSDVAVGALVGSAIGWVVPEMHRTKAGSEAEVSPVVTPGGAAVVFSLR